MATAYYIARAYNNDSLTDGNIAGYEIHSLRSLIRIRTRI